MSSPRYDPRFGPWWQSKLNFAGLRVDVKGDTLSCRSRLYEPLVVRVPTRSEQPLSSITPTSLRDNLDYQLLLSLHSENHPILRRKSGGHSYKKVDHPVIEALYSTLQELTLLVLLFTLLDAN